MTRFLIALFAVCLFINDAEAGFFARLRARREARQQSVPSQSMVAPGQCAGGCANCPACQQSSPAPDPFTAVAPASAGCANGSCNVARPGLFGRLRR